MRRVPRRLALGVILGAIVGGCLSPTLPLPPPDRPKEIEGPNAQGMVILRGTVPHANCIAEAFNDRAGKGAIHKVGEDFRYELELAAQVGDAIQLWYVVGTSKSQAVVFTIPEPVDAGAPEDAGAD